MDAEYFIDKQQNIIYCLFALIDNTEPNPYFSISADINIPIKLYM